MDRRVAASPRHRAPTVEEADESAVWINAITVPQGQGPELEKRFAARQHSVDREPEFEGFQLPRPTAGEDRQAAIAALDAAAVRGLGFGEPPADFPGLA